VLYVHKKPIVFEASSGVADEHDQMKFITYQPGRKDYFILDDMQDGYESVPAGIKGKYVINGKVIPVKLTKSYGSH
jgi:hypothetical protein